MAYDTPHIDRGAVGDLNAVSTALRESWLRGSEKVFRETVPGTSGSKLRTVRSNAQVHAVLARNTSGITLLPGRAVQWADEGQKIDVNGYVTAGRSVAGVVDDHLDGTRGVLDDELFWLLRRGRVLCKSPAAAAEFPTAVVEGEEIYALPGASATTAAAGRVTKFGGQYIYGSIVNSTEHENTTTAADFDEIVTLPANFLGVGDILKIRAQVFVLDNNSTDTLTLLLQLQNDTIISTGAVDVADADVGYFDVELIVRAIGAAATAEVQATGVHALGVPGTVTAKPFGYNDGTNFDSTAAAEIAINADWSVAHADNEAYQAYLTVQLIRDHVNHYLGRAADDMATSSTTSDLLVDLAID